MRNKYFALNLFRTLADLTVIMSVVILLSGTLLVLTAIADSPNLIPNASLETPNSSNSNQPLNWATDHWGTNKANFSYLTTGHTGYRSVKVQITKSGSGDAKWYFQEVPVVPGNIYLFSDYSISNIKSRVTIQYHLKNGSFQYVDLGTPAASANWQQFQKSFTVPSNVANITIFHLITSVGYLTVDDYSLTLVTSDTTPPNATISQPTAGATVSGITTLAATATDNVLVKNVQFYIDGVSFGSFLTTPPYTTTWNTTSVPNGTHTIMAKASDSSGNTASSSIQVTVGNAVPSPSPFDFSLSNGGSMSVTQGQSATNSVMASLSSGTTQSVSFSTSGLPSGVAASYSSSSCNPTCSTTLTLDTTVSTLTGTYTVTVTGNSGTLNRITSFSLTVNPTSPPAPSDNVVPNPSVENASSSSATTPTNWVNEKWGTNKTSFTYFRNQGHTGSSSVKVQMSFYTSGDAKWYFNPILVTPGDTYNFSDWYKSDVLTHVVIDFTNNDGSDDYYLELRTVPIASDWTQYSESFQIPYNAKTMTVFHLIEAVGSLTTDDYSLVKFTPKGFSRALVTMTFDNGFEDNITTAIPILDQYGFKVTYCYSTEYVEGQPDQVATVQAITSHGHETCSHAVHHSDMTLETTSTINYELTHSQGYLQSITGQPVKNFISPFGAYNDAVLNAIKAVYRSHRPTDEGYNTQENFDSYRLKVQNMQPTTNLAQFQGWINQAMKDKSWLVLVYHRVASTNLQDFDTPQSDFRPQMDIIKNAGIAVVTTDQALDEITPQIMH